MYMSTDVTNILFLLWLLLQHPGNIIIQQGHRYSHFHQKGALVPASQPQGAVQENSIVLVDAGMVAELTRLEQVNFMGLLECIGEGDARGAADHILDFSTAGRAQYSAETIVAFHTGMQQLFSRVCRGYGTGMDIGEILRGLLGVVRDHRITIETNYATLVMNALCLDGMALHLLPNYNVMDAAKPLFRFHRRASRIPLLNRSRWLMGRALSLMLWIKKQGDQKVLRLLESLVKKAEKNIR